MVDEEIALGAGLRLRRWSATDDAALTKAAAESWEHLRPWMPWAREPVPPTTHEPFLTRSDEEWARGETHGYGLFDDAGTVLGSFGLHRRIGPTGREIGYFLHAACVGRGLATEAAAALTTLAFGIDGVDHVEIHCDVGNVRSAAVPGRLGYRHVETRAREPLAHAETGEEMVWRMTKAEWWPAWATEPVEVRPADPGWQQAGDAERRGLDAALARWLVAPVEHVGSTAVPGLAAKPILDLQAAVADLSCAPAIARALAPAGWHAVPAVLDGRPWRRFLVRVLDGRRAAHLHLLTLDSDRWTDQPRFRDALRADPVLAGAYAGLKQSLAAAHPDDREAYSAAKAEFVRGVLAG